MIKLFSKKENNTPQKLKTSELIAFCSEMSLYLRAGNPVSECFYIFLKQDRAYLPKNAIVELYSETEMGTPLFEAMTLTGIFPDYMLSMVNAGERTGHLESVFRNLSKYYLSQERTRRNLRSAILYPLILLLITLLVVFIIMPEVLPIYNDAFSALGGTIPAFTFVLINIGNAIGSVRYYILGILLLIFIVFGILMAIKTTREKIVSNAKKNFYKKNTGIKLNSAFFISLLSLGVSGGLDIDDTLKMIENSFGDRFGPNAVTKCREDIASGTGFAKAVNAAGLLSDIDSSILEAGIATGNTDVVLEELTIRTEEDAQNAINKTVGAIEPAIVLVMSVIVAIILIAVMFPLLGIMSAIV